MSTITVLPKTFRVMMYADRYVKVSELGSGIYESDVPYCYPADTTIELLVSMAESVRQRMPNEYTDNYIKNIQQCELRLTELTLYPNL